MTNEELEKFKNMSRYEVIRKYTKMRMCGQINGDQYTQALLAHERLQTPKHDWTEKDIEWIKDEFSKKESYED